MGVKTIFRNWILWSIAGSALQVQISSHYTHVARCPACLLAVHAMPCNACMQCDACQVMHNTCIAMLCMQLDVKLGLLRGGMHASQLHARYIDNCNT